MKSNQPPRNHRTLNLNTWGKEEIRAIEMEYITLFQQQVVYTWKCLVDLMVDGSTSIPLQLCCKGFGIELGAYPIFSNKHKSVKKTFLLLWENWKRRWSSSVLAISGYNAWDYLATLLLPTLANLNAGYNLGSFSFFLFLFFYRVFFFFGVVFFK